MLKKYSSALIALSFFYLIVIVTVSVSLKINGGKLSYALDDTFIHMAIAKHFAINGVWGVTPYEFSSTTSSPLYTFLLAVVFYCTAVSTAVPLVLNVIFATILIFLTDYVLQKYSLSLRHRLAIITLIVLFTPLVILTMIGMEHVLQIIFTIWFVHLSAQVLTKMERFKTDYVNLILSGALLSFCRYEGLFVVLPVCLLLLARKKITISFLLGLGALVPLILYGLLSVNEGSYWMPNSVLLKGQEVSLFSWGGIKNLYARPLFIFSQAPWLFVISAILFMLGANRHFRLKISIWDPGQVMILIFFAALLFHLEFARVGWAFRYEAYLVSLGILLLGIFAKETFYIPINHLSLTKKIATSFIALVLTLPILSRGASALLFAPSASKNIYEQQYQMGRFLKAYYNEQPVLAGDIGAINFLADLKCLDIIGLGSIEIAKARRDGQFGSEFLSSLVKKKNVRIAVVYDHELAKNPVDWEKIAEWQILNNIVAASDKVSFYAVDKSEAEGLRSNLKEFQRELPSTVKVFYY